MPVIRIEEHTKATDGWQVKVSFDHGPPYDATVRNPFSEDKEQDLAWYFETYPNFPSSKDSGKAKNVAASIKSYGEALFDDVFRNRKAWGQYSKIREIGLSNLQIEIAGNTPQFHALHWEALKDPERPLPLALQATVIRQNLNPPAEYAPLRSSPTINILIVTARPFVEKDADYRAISRPLVEVLRNELTEIHILRPGTYKALENHLSDVENEPDKGKGYYHVIHFDMHGIVCSYEQLQKEQEQTNRYQFTERYGNRIPEIQKYPDVKAFLLFESEENHKADLVSDEELCDLLTTYQIPIAILNACQSGKQVGERETSLGSRIMLAGVQLVLAMGYSVRIQAAEKLMKVMYSQLFKSGDLSIAIHQARKELYNDRKRYTPFGKAIYLEDWLLPIIYQNKPLQLSQPDFSQKEGNEYYEREAERQKYFQYESFRKFVGRDIDILQIEKRLLTKENKILLVRGIGGVGKTTLFRHLEVWWLITDFVQRTFYFSCDEKAWTLREMMTEIALKFGEKYYAEFLLLSEKAKPTKLIHDLRKSHYLLILDHLEAITGTTLTVQQKLPPEEQDALHNFLKNLAGGQTLVLLGSRSNEDWLKEGTFNDNIYELTGLDPEAASLLAKRILGKNHAENHFLEDDLQELLKILGGLPLAMEVVLAHLISQTPKKVLKAELESEKDRVDESEDREEQLKSILTQNAKSIGHCIDYLYRYLLPEVQQMLLCLAPFTRILRREPVLNLYLPYLQQQPILTNLPFSHWLEMIQETQKWSLLTPDPDMPQLLHLQPIFRYFLRGHLEAPEQAKEKQAIETAFLLLYEQISDTIYQQLSSEDSNKSRAAQKLASLEYENLETALHLALQAQVSISGPFQALFKYLDITEDANRALKLAKNVLICIETYAPEIRKGSLCRDYIRVISKVAFQQAIISQYSEAEKTYQRALSLLPELECLNEYEHNEWEADIHHELGNLAFEQNLLSEAESHYKKALQIKGKIGDSRSLIITYKKLGDLAQQQKKALDAHEYYEKALNLFVKLNNRHSYTNW